MPDITIHQSKYGEDPCNFHIAKVGDELQVELIYPPHTPCKEGKGKCKYVCVNQESARATDGVRLWYDYNRDGWVIVSRPPHSNGPMMTRSWIPNGARWPS